MTTGTAMVGVDKGPQDRGHWPEPVAKREVEDGEGGKTANQIISASRCLVGVQRASLVGSTWVLLLLVMCASWWRMGACRLRRAPGC